jgi:hypothetical protein
VTERFATVWHNEVKVKMLLKAQPIAFGTGPMWTVEGKQPRGELGITDATGNAGEFLAEDELAAVHGVDGYDTVGEAHRGLDGIRQALFEPRLDDQAVNDCLNRMVFHLVEIDFLGQLANLPIHPGAGVPLPA